MRRPHGGVSEHGGGVLMAGTLRLCGWKGWWHHGLRDVDSRKESREM